MDSAKQFKFVDYNDNIGNLEQINEEGVRNYLTPSGNRYPSITTIMSWYSADSIKKWRNKVGEKEANRITKKATKKGTALHNLCENYLTNQENLGEINFQTLDDFKIVKKVLDEHVDNIYCVEKRLYSDYIGIAGTTDCIAEYDGVISIIDFKTARKMKKKEYITNYFMQASGYAVMFEELTGIPVPQIIIIMVSEGEVCVFKEKRNDYIFKLIDVVNKYKISKNI